MPILEVTNTHLTQRCATCEGLRELGFRELTPTSDEGDVLALPACSCGSVEFLVGAPQDEPPHPSPGSFGHLHRLVVDTLVALVREAMEDDEELPIADAVSQQLGQEAVQMWFPDGVSLEPRKPATDDPEPPTDEEEAWTPN